jgi:hypothetical protein
MMKQTQYKLQNTIATGATTGQTFSTKPIRGTIVAIYIQFTNTTPGSSSDRDVNIYEMNPFDDDDKADALQEILNIGTLGAAPADDNGVYYPRRAAQDITGTNLVFIASGEIIPVRFEVFGHKLLLDITAAAAGDITTAYVVVEEF